LAFLFFRITIAKQFALIEIDLKSRESLKGA
jgi:hypothetical protein